MQQYHKPFISRNGYALKLKHEQALLQDVTGAFSAYFLLMQILGTLHSPWQVLCFLEDCKEQR
jgi:hypothetical protein